MHPQNHLGPRNPWAAPLMTNSIAKVSSLRQETVKLWATINKQAWAAVSEEIENELAKIRLLENERIANELWVLATLTSAHLHLIDAWEHNLKDDFYLAWCALERAELDLLFVAKNMEWCDTPEMVGDLREHVSRWQSLYPYGVFMSPEFLVHERKCNICEAIRSPFKPCEHRKGKVYNGKLCVDIVTQVEIIGSALVTDPVQKYSVLQPADETAEAFASRHSVIKYAVSLLQNPYHLKEVRKTTIKWPLSKFPGLTKTDPCPCESGKAFQVCCEDSKGVLRPHIWIDVANENVNQTPTFQYPSL